MPQRYALFTDNPNKQLKINEKLTIYPKNRRKIDNKLTSGPQTNKKADHPWPAICYYLIFLGLPLIQHLSSIANIEFASPVCSQDFHFYFSSLFLFIRLTTTFTMTSISSGRLSAIIRVRATKVLSAMRLLPSG